MAFRSRLQRIGHLRIVVACVASLMAASIARAEQDLDGQVRAALQNAGLTGTIQFQLVPALGRPLDPQLADLGRLLWFDKSGDSTTTIRVAGATRRAGLSATRNRSRSASRTTTSSGPTEKGPVISVAHHSRRIRRSIRT